MNDSRNTTGPAITVRVLGSLLAVVEGRAADLGGARQRSLLGMLLAARGEVVSADRLIEDLWRGKPPPRAINALQSYVSRLRRVFEPGRPPRTPGRVIVSAAPGYALDLPRESVDAWQFEALLRQPHDLNSASTPAVLAEALALWRGPPFAEFADEPWAAGEIARLEELRTTARECAVEAAIRTGRATGTTVADAEALTLEAPLREQGWRLLALSQYFSGRQADALTTLRNARAVLARELGLDPSPHLAELERAVLVHDVEPYLSRERDRDLRPLDRPAPSIDRTAAAARAARPFVGRARELAHLTARCDDAKSGRPVFVLVSGEPGVGKTALLEKFAQDAGRDGLLVLWGRGVTEDGAPAFWPWRQVFRHWLAGTDPGTAAAIPAGTIAEAARTVPELDRRPGGGRAAVVPGTAEERFASFDAVTAAITGIAAAAGGLVIVLDDLHWADPASLLLLTHLARHAAAPLAVVAAFRPYDLRRTAHGGAALAQLAGLPGASSLELSGFSEAEVAEQMSEISGRACDPAEAAAVARRTAGNPLFVREIARLRQTAPDTPGAEVPAALRDAIRQHLATVTPPCRATLAAAAVLSAGIDPVTLAAAAEAPLEDVLAGIDEGIVASLVRPTTDGTGFRFVHDLVRDSLRLDVSAGRRRRIHLRAAEHLEATAGGDRLTRVAHHRIAALPLGDPAAAVRAAAGAARLAMNQLAYEEAVTLYDRALAAEAGCGAAAGDRGELLIGKAQAQYLAYDVAEAMRTCEEAAAHARHAGDAAVLGQAVLVMAEVADGAWLAKIKPWCEEALAGLPHHDSVLRARLLAHRVVIGSARGEAASAAADSGFALAMAERLDDPLALISALRARQHAYAAAEGNSERLALGNRMLELAERTGDSTALWGHLWSFDALMQLGRVDDAELRLDLLEPVVARLRQPLARWHLLRSRASIHLCRGQFAEAQHALDEACRVAAMGNHANAAAGIEFARAFVDAMTAEDVSQAAVDAVTGTVLVRNHGVRDLALASFYFLHDRVLDASRCYRQAPPLDQLPVPPSLRLIVYSQYSEVAAACGDTAGARCAYRHLLPYADYHITPGTGGGGYSKGSAHHYLGLTAEACGHLDTAIGHSRAATTANASLLPYEAQSQHLLASQLLRRGNACDRPEAQELAQAAHATATRLKMPLLRRRAEALIAAVRSGDAPASTS